MPHIGAAIGAVAGAALGATAIVAGGGATVAAAGIWGVLGYTSINGSIVGLAAGGGAGIGAIAGSTMEALGEFVYGRARLRGRDGSAAPAPQTSPPTSPPISSPPPELAIAVVAVITVSLLCCFLCRRRYKPSERLSQNMEDEVVSVTADAMQEECEYARRCKRFLLSLKLPNELLDTKHDKCFCSECLNLRRSRPQNTDSEVLKGWSGFGVKLPPRARPLQVFEGWPITYHGLAAANVNAVLLTGGFVIPGDHLQGNYIQESRNTAGRQGVGVFYTSPSPSYAGLQMYATPSRFENNFYQVMFMCRQNGKSGVTKQGETMGFLRSKLDPPLSLAKSFLRRSDIEWKSISRSECIPTRILVREWNADGIQDQDSFRSPNDANIHGRTLQEIQGRLWM
eukprot:TRINITY_DN23843_c0_g3_i1.p1 TRINITY_DN23843_c0_g3~~TRINITY_DN23843_c0_g3_i1.p1  ORF type:complete len:397 (+),score=27.65 TRINITY_DN23843_c0_g3_i1:198-1388(+)